VWDGLKRPLEIHENLKVGEFKAQADDGRVFTIYEYQEYLNAGGLDEAHEKKTGSAILVMLYTW
jgi:hypothetical protein